MEDDATEERGDRLTRSAFWASAAFYVLVAFEFIYMATPFAAYVYSAYVPGLNLVGDSPTASWLVSFFLPHIVAQTTSPLVNMHKAVGAVLAIAGLCGLSMRGSIFTLLRWSVTGKRVEQVHRLTPLHQTPGILQCDVEGLRHVKVDIVGGTVWRDEQVGCFP